MEINNSSFDEALSKNVLNIPETDNLPGTKIQGSYCFIADEAFQRGVTTTFGGRYYPQGYVDHEDSHGILHKSLWRFELGQLSNTFTDIREQVHTTTQNKQKLGENNLSIISRVLKEGYHGNASMYEEPLMNMNQLNT